jgi:hypothetical protein
LTHSVHEERWLRLAAIEGDGNDIGSGIARIGYDSMESMGVSTGDFIEIVGKRKTVAKVLPLYPADEGSGKIIKIDELIRKNADIVKEGTVFVRGIKPAPAKDVTVEPLQALPLTMDEGALAHSLQNMALVAGDSAVITHLEERILFQVAKTSPGDEPVMVTPYTKFSIVNRINRISLKVARAFDEEEEHSATSMVRTEKEIMARLSVKEGDFVEIKGSRTTIAKIFPLNRKDNEKRIIRLGRLVRENSLGDDGSQSPSVIVQKIDYNVPQAELVVISPLQDSIPRISSGQIAKSLASSAATLGDKILVPYSEGEALAFRIEEVKPSTKQAAVLITKDTKFLIQKSVIGEQPVIDMKCSRCSQRLAGSIFEPNPHWGFSGYLCESCHQVAAGGTKAWKAINVQDYFSKMGNPAGSLMLLAFDQILRVIFEETASGTSSSKISSFDNIKGCRIVTLMEPSTGEEKEIVKIKFLAGGNEADDAKKEEEVNFSLGKDTIRAVKEIVSAIERCKMQEAKDSAGQQLKGNN